MKVSELIEALRQYDPGDTVILGDTHRNWYSPVNDLMEGVYVGTETGNVYLRELDPQDIEQRYTEEDLYQGEDGQNAVILYPLA